MHVSLNTKITFLLHYVDIVNNAACALKSNVKILFFVERKLNSNGSAGYKNE